MSVRPAIDDGTIGDRLWFYANYHCNLVCTYCLTESGPKVARRELAPETILRSSRRASELGFGSIGITGGEPFLVPEMPSVLRKLADLLPTVVLSNGTVFTRERIAALAPLGGRDFKVQISLDSSRPQANDEMRGPENFRRVVEAIPKLVERGIGVRIATTVEVADPADIEALCTLHRSLGVPDEEHVVRGIVRRGRALTEELGEPVGPGDFVPELTLTADGAFWSPFGPTVVGGVLDTDLLLTRTIEPLDVPADAIVRVAGRTEGTRPLAERFT